MSIHDPVFDAFRRWGYLQADLDPLGRLEPLPLPDLEWDGEAAAAAARKIYCGPIGVEFMHIADPVRRAWVIGHMESGAGPTHTDPDHTCGLLARAEVFEQVIQKRYLGAKRFSIEGVAAAVPLLAEIAETVAVHGAKDIVLGTSHRGRLSIMVSVVAKSPEDIFAQFEDVDPKSVLGGGDVKYHIGANGLFPTRIGTSVRISLVSNPSHLEAVDPVALGRARAKQRRLGDPGRLEIVPVIFHGDGAFAGQGVVAETLNMADLDGYTVGGTIHVVLNNMIGFTATPPHLHSSRYATDVAKRLPIPIFHVNGEDPEAVLRVARLAAEFRTEFRTDVVIDLIGYRRWGHSEVDDPKLTSPLLYRKIEALPPLWRAYASRIGWSEERTARYESELVRLYDEAQEKARTLSARPALFALPAYWSGYTGGRYYDSYEVDTAVETARLSEVAERIASVPEGFQVHPKVRKLLEQRRKMGAGNLPVDWAMAEALAFGSLLWDGVCVRLSGEDSRRGTFNQRHAVVIDVETADEHISLRHLHDDQGAFGCYDSPLSEFAVLGFEYGFSRDHPEALVLWEAQFGDFVNGGQVILDQFLSAGEDKWGLLSGLVVLLPHGYEGQGPEHSSSRPERFLQLAAEDNIQVCQPTTAAQYFHLLRRQMLRKWRKPLIVFTPKSMLREKGALSSLEEIGSGRFHTVIGDARGRELAGESAAGRGVTDSAGVRGVSMGDAEAGDVSEGDVEVRDVSEVDAGARDASEGGASVCDRVLVCTGKVVHELRAERERRGHARTAIVALEQLYPFPEAELRAELHRYPETATVVWVQEEPGNMGALGFVMPRLQRLAGKRRVSAVRRAASASPATGSKKASDIEQAAVISRAFGVRTHGE